MENFVVHPFNAGFFLLLAIAACPNMLAFFILRKKSYSAKYAAAVKLYCALAIFLIGYKLLLPLDAGYMQRCNEYRGGFTYLNELPLNPCNIAVLLFPVALLRKNNTLIATCFFESLAGSLLAITTPIYGFDGYPVFSIHVFGYYVSHMALLLTTVLLAVFGIYKPKLADMKKVMLTLFILACAVFLIDLGMRVTGICETANYFFLFSHDENVLLKFFYELVPVPFVFTMIPGTIGSLILIPLIILIYNGCLALHRKITK